MAFTNEEDFLANFSAVNKFSTTLASDINASATTIPLTNIGNLTASPKGVVSIDNEHIFYGGINGNSLTGCERGIDNSISASHSSGATVEQRVTAYIFNQLKQATKDIPKIDFSNASNYQLSSDSFIPLSGNIPLSLSAQSGSSDDVVTIDQTNISEGECLIIQSLNNLTYKTSGNLSIGSDITTTTGDVVAFYKFGSVWKRMFTSLVSAGGGGEANTASNLGTTADGQGMFSNKVGVDLQFKRLKASTYVNLTSEANDVLVGLTGSVTAGLTALNSVTSITQSFSSGTAGSDFNISSNTGTGVHTFNLPDASTANRGAVSLITQSFTGQKTFKDSVIAHSPYLNDSTTARTILLTDIDQIIRFTNTGSIVALLSTSLSSFKDGGRIECLRTPTAGQITVSASTTAVTVNNVAGGTKLSGATGTGLAIINIGVNNWEIYG